MSKNRRVATLGPRHIFLSGRMAAVSALTALAFLLTSAVAIADTTTAAMRGNILNPEDAPVADATVRIIDQRTGQTRSASTNAAGTFYATGLQVGGPYTVVVSSPKYANHTVNDVYLNLGDTYTFQVNLGSATLEEIVVTAADLSGAALALGPSAAFGLADLESAPAINRDIKDVIRIDPRVYVDEAFVDAVQCGGANPRFNSLTVDGVRLNDNFGLNSNGYPTERMPFPFDSIEQIAVELAPFDVQFGGFSACNINAVTKSGTNEFHGNVFYDYTDDGLSGDSLEGDSIDLGDFDEERWGVSVGGPIIKDKLFFFGAYEKFDGATVFDRGPAGSGRGREVEGVSQAQFDEIGRIAREIYNYEPGDLPASLPVEDEKYFVKLDWIINESHRASVNYTYNDGFNISQADSDSNELEFSNHYYERGAELKTYVGQLFSDWSENFSTEVRIAYTELDNRQISLAGTDFGEVQIRTENDPDGDGINSRATVYLGADDSRHANKLYYEDLSYKIAASYTVGNHLITGGYEREEFDVFNLFIQEAEGEYRFSSVADFEAGKPNRITYENAAPSNVPADAAAKFGYEINTLYLQDEVLFPDQDLTIVAGLRYDWYTSSDEPALNPNFEARYGFSNTETFDGIDLLQPRLGFNWNPTDRLSIRGGIGLYSGGNPNVWLSNNYSNNGITQVEVQDRSLDDPGNPDSLFTIPFNGSGRPIYDIPQALFDAVASGTADSGVNALDKGFDLPSAWKFSLGGTVSFDLPQGWGENYVFSTDFLYSRSQDSAIIKDGTLEQVGTAVDGRPIYRGIDRSDPDCVDPTSSDCSSRRSQDFILTNVTGGDAEQKVFSFSLSNDYDFGLSWTFGYAYTQANDVNPMTSSVAFSNFANIAVSDPNNPNVETSNYEIPHRFTFRTRYEHAFFGDNMTTVSLFGTYSQGRPYTYTFDSGFMFGDSVGFISRQLLYVPSGPTDPNVIFGSGFDTDAFFDFVKDDDLGRYAGRILPRNARHSAWWMKWDLKVEQEFPGFREGNKIKAFLVIENLGNLLNDDWGVLKEASFPRYQPVVDAGINSSTGQYEFNEFIQPNGQSRATDASLWEARLGIRYDF